VEAAAHTSTPGRCIAVGQVGSICAIAVAAVARQFSADRTLRAAKGAGDVGVGSATYQKSSNTVPFFLRELAIATHVCILFLAGIDAYDSISALSFLCQRLHLLVESAKANKSLEQSP
jgi:hypothetical protein